MCSGVFAEIELEFMGAERQAFQGPAGFLPFCCRLAIVLFDVQKAEEMAEGPSDQIIRAFKIAVLAFEFARADGKHDILGKAGLFCDDEFHGLYHSFL